MSGGGGKNENGVKMGAGHLKILEKPPNVLFFLEGGFRILRLPSGKPKKKEKRR